MVLREGWWWVWWVGVAWVGGRVAGSVIGGVVVGVVLREGWWRRAGGGVCVAVLAGRVVGWRVSIHKN